MNAGTNSWEAIPDTGGAWKVINAVTRRIVVERTSREQALRVKHALEANREKRERSMAAGG